MKVLLMKINLRASWVHSLKEKRMVVKSIVQKLENKFNISAAEVSVYQVFGRIALGGSCVMWIRKFAFM
jgi:uncharacterized protein YlxP (DUF503 family)